MNFPNRSRAEIDAEAAAWMARLMGPQRREETDAAFKEWLKSPAHAQAFERASELWDMLPGAKQGARLSADVSTIGLRRGRWPAMAAAAAIAVLALGIAVLTGMPKYETAIGQQQVVTLDDGTRLSLNVDSKVRVLYGSSERRVMLDRGEAMFEVAKDSQRPFVVVSDDEQVTALGTTFVVRRDHDKLAVTLIEGRVEVSRAREEELMQVAVLTPGQRVTVTKTAGAALDRPAVEAVTAWRRGEAMFDDTSLIEVAQELNRYGITKLVVADPSLASLRMSGVFATNDIEEVANAIAKLHGLHVQRRGDRLLLTRAH